MCDTGYLLPGLVAGKQAAALAPAGTDIRLFLDAPSMENGAIAQIAKETGVRVSLAPPGVSDQLSALTSPTEFHPENWVNRSSLLRFFLTDLVGDAYDRVLYLDCDIQVLRSLAPFFEIDSPPGHFLVARDGTGLAAAAPDMPGHEEERAHLIQLGLPESYWGGYFNAGVMLGDMEAWRFAKEHALAFYMQYPERCKWADQDALNAVLYNRIKHVSMRWNFPQNYMTYPAYTELDPAILHFVSVPKPWQGRISPWGAAIFRPYTDLAQQLKALDLPWRRLPWYRLLRYEWWARKKMLLSDRAYKRRASDLLAQDEPHTSLPGPT